MTRSFSCFLPSLGLILTLATAFGSSPLNASLLLTEPELLKPTRAQAITSNRIMNGVSQLHMRKHRINNELSEQLFDSFIDSLDHGKAYFLADDITYLQKYRYRLDDALEDSNLNPAFEIFNLYQERISERLKYTLDLLAKGIDSLDFKKDETLERDPDKAHWSTSVSEINDLSRRRLKEAIITMRLMGKKDKEISETLTRRYENQLNRVAQANSEDAFELYMNAFTQIYDPHTQYFSPKVSENFNINMSLQLEGIGAVLQSDNEYTKVASLVTGGPADKGKELQEADRIIGVGQLPDDIIDVVGWRLDEVVKRIRGKKGTTVYLEVIPAEAKTDTATKVISIQRDTVKLEDRAAQATTHKITMADTNYNFGIIHIPTFYANLRCMKSSGKECRSTTEDVKHLLAELSTQDIDGLIIDLRDNGGGSLTEVNHLLGLFIPTGPTVQVKSYSGDIEVLKDRDPAVMYSGPLAVMVNRLSASASEIFAGAIQDYQRGIIVGDRTFGKGTVQSLQSLDHGVRGDQLKVTMAKFYRISGESNQHKGIVPDILFPSLIDHEEIGESSLPGALPSDHIPAAKYFTYDEISPVMAPLKEAHVKRAATDPEFEYIRDQLTTYADLREKTKVTLNYAKRLEQKSELEAERLTIENKRRLARGEKPFKTFAEFEDFDEESAKSNRLTGNKGIEIDYEMEETSKILADMLGLQSAETQMAAH